MFFLDILSTKLLCPKKTANNISNIPIIEYIPIFSDRRIYPHITANAGIRYATYDKKTGPDVLVM